MSSAAPKPLPQNSEVEPGSIATLEEAFAELQSAKANGNDLSRFVEACRETDSEARNRHAVLREVGEFMLTEERWDLAEEFAIRSLKSLPRYGAAFKLLGLALHGAGNPDDAAICHRYGLPPSMRDKHFSDIPIRWTQSDAENDSGVRKQVAFPESTHALSPPKQMQERDIVELSAASLTAIEAYTTVIDDGRLWFDSFNTVAWDKQGRIISDLCRGYAEVVQGSLGAKQPQRLSGRVCLLGNRNSDNYYHWMNDTLPRLEVLRASGESLDSIDWFVLNPIKHDFHRETLERFGIGEDRLHFNNRSEYVAADQLLMPMYGSNSLGMSQGAWNPQFLQREFCAELPTEKSLRLYVSRGSSGARGVSNEPELIEYLEQAGFMVVKAENHTLAEQAKLFAAASVVFGPHGAGFSNIAFCQPGTKVIELFSAHMAPCFWVISELMGLEHYAHFCGAFDENTRPSDGEQYHRSADDRRRSAFYVDVKEVAKLLEFAGVGAVAG